MDTVKTASVTVRSTKETFTRAGCEVAPRKFVTVTENSTTWPAYCEKHNIIRQQIFEWQHQRWCPWINIAWRHNWYRNTEDIDIERLWSSHELHTNSYSECEQNAVDNKWHSSLVRGNNLTIREGDFNLSKPRKSTSSGVLWRKIEWDLFLFKVWYERQHSYIALYQRPSWLDQTASHTKAQVTGKK